MNEISDLDVKGYIWRVAVIVHIMTGRMSFKKQLILLQNSMWI